MKRMCIAGGGKDGKGERNKTWGKRRGKRNRKKAGGHKEREVKMRKEGRNRIGK